MVESCYLRSMGARNRLVMILALVALLVAACGDTPGADSTATADAADTATADAADTADAAAIDLGDLEAGYGPGSLVADAGEVLVRLNDLPDMWSPFVMPFTYDPRPGVCEAPEPTAVTGTVLSFLDPGERLFFDTIVTQVEVYDTAEQATVAVELVNGPDAAECDVASLAQVFEEGIPDQGIEFDFGSGVGEPVENPRAVTDDFVAATRRFEGALNVGSVTRDLVQVETSAASGSTVIRVASVSASGRTNDILDQASELVFSAGPPDVSQDGEIDALVDRVRSSILTVDDVPSFYEPAETIIIANDSAEPGSCFEFSVGEVRIDGPNWAAVNPGAGVSRLWQLTTIHEDEAAAAASFDELVAVGGDCFVESIGLPEDQFQVTGQTFDSVEVDGLDVVTIQLDISQFIEGQEFEVEAGFAAAQIGQFTTGANFFGLIGDSPELAELAALAAQRLDSQ